MPIYFQHRQLVIPGELLAEGEYEAAGACYKENGKIYAAAVGLAELREKNIVYVIPLAGSYIPKVGDLVIGKIVDIVVGGWHVDIKAPYTAVLPVAEAFTKPIDLGKVDLRTILDIGDLILAKVISFDLTKENPVTLTIKEARLGKIEKGVLVEISPVKIPRVIGKKGSMINLIKSEMKCEIIIGQNGRILVTGKSMEDELFVSQLIKFIERESHISGLTEKVKELIRKYKESKGEIS